MIRRATFPKVLLFLAAFVFFSANTVYFLEADTKIVGSGFGKTCHFDFDHVVKKGPHLNVKAAMLVNYDNGEVIYAKNAEQVRPIASLSKLVAVMVVIDQKVDLDKTIKISREDARRSSRSRLQVGFELTVRDLLHATLMNSDNRAARAMARATCGSIEKFATEMNKKARQLGLKKSVFFEPTGLDSRNVSTAHEIAKILHYAYEYDLIAEITAKKQYKVKIQNRKNTYRPMANTNMLIHSKYSVLSGKTGYIRAADYCLTTLVKNRAGERLTLVVLGAPGDKLRFREARRLIDWGFSQI